MRLFKRNIAKIKKIISVIISLVEIVMAPLGWSPEVRNYVVHDFFVITDNWH